jgi:CHASE2 domain-containing sensor protein
MITRALRSLTFRTVALGVALTLAVVSADRAGWLEAVERWCYDRRSRYFQYFTPPPTDKLVHLVMDDAAYETIGEWPWPRATLAEVIDELRLAGVEALSIDVIFAERREQAVESSMTPPRLSWVHHRPRSRPSSTGWGGRGFRSRDQQRR